VAKKNEVVIHKALPGSEKRALANWREFGVFFTCYQKSNFNHL